MSVSTNVTADDILKFWFEETDPSQHYKSNPAFDALIRERFATAVEAGGAGALDAWAATGDGALALVILLDQFSRNIYRGQAKAFAQDAKAIEIAEAAIAKDLDLDVPTDRRAFFYMPFMHAEDLDHQERCIDLIEARIGEDSGNLPHAIWHRDVIAKFGRFPYRNDALGRETTAEEAAWMEKANTPG